MSASGLPVLWHIQISHYNEKARWALDLKAVRHVRRAPQPGLHPIRAWRLTRGITLPVLELDGEAIGDSTRIIETLERRFPDPPLYPADPGERERALALEDFFDEHMGPDVRRLIFLHQLSAPRAVDRIGDLGPGGPVRTRVVKAGFPMFRVAVRARYGAAPARAERALGRIRAGLERIEAERGPSGYLVGERFSVADLAAAALLGPLVRPPEFPYPLPAVPPGLQEAAAALAGPGWDWVLDMYARHRPASAAVRG